ncbi:TIGR01777 family oxidoreductase [Algiphilus sp.]|uniref:TIGR01777 family oxidoreductase n=1 Tax=Algiphilus sp. TaxID=1872431 RepID=UPI0025BE2651|nr:TIGR01777 family oxidoreductase [Algiphilus sp.]MCK5771461.1 TIGR01777 family oxidoreductase [Algiphilus sp.]
MRILITGGTGFIGVPLCRHLERAGHEVVVWSRDPDAARDRLPADVAAVGRPEDAGRVDAAVNLAGESLGDGRWNAARRRRIIESRIETTRRLVDWMAQAGVQHLVSASAIGYYGVRGDEPVSEDDPPASRLQGGLDVCAPWEAEARRAEEAGARVAIVRIGLVLHPEGGGLQQMLTPFRLGIGGPMGSGRQCWSWIHRHDLVRLFTFLLEHPEAHGVFNGTAPNPVSQRAFAQALGRVLRRPSFMPTPAFVLRAAFGDMAELLTEGQCVLPKRTEAAGFTFEHRELERALRDLLR